MSFFDLTSLGYDNKFKSLKHLEPISSIQLPKISTTNQKSSVEKQLAREMTGNYQSREWSSPAVSNLNYRSLRTMHVRGDRDAYHTVRRPLTESQQIGWWIKDAPLKQNEPWTRRQHHVHPLSEMTKFVDDMMLADRYFQLF